MTSWCTNANANHANYLSVDLLLHANCPPTVDLRNCLFNKRIHDSRVLTIYKLKFEKCQNKM